MLTSKLIDLRWNGPQEEIFFDHDRPGATIVCHKGRQSGVTHGGIVKAALLAQAGFRVLWADVDYLKVAEYQQNYLKPFLDKIPPKYYKLGLHKFTHASGGFIDFRSLRNVSQWHGSGYDKVFLNEPRFTVTEKTFDEALGPMLFSSKNSTVWVTGTPGGYAGMFYKLYLRATVDKIPGYYDLQYSSYSNIEENGGFLSKERIDAFVRSVPRALRDQEVYGMFVAADGVLILEKWLAKKPLKEFPNHLSIAFGIDVASGKETGAYHSIAVLGVDDRKYLYCLNVKRGKWSFNELQSNIKSLADHYKPKLIGVEDRGVQSWLIQGLRSNYPALGSKTIGVTIENKHEGLYPIGIKMEDQQMYYNEAINGEFFEELLSFPHCVYKDQVDSLSLAYETSKYLTSKPFQTARVIY